MGSSNRKKKEKKQDFQKTKLKVGKARPKNTNATDTSFVAKSIYIKEQSLTEKAPEKAVRFHYNLSLASSKNESQKKDALAYLAHALTTSRNAANGLQDVSSLPVSAGTILSKTQHLIMDENAAVRSNLLRLCRSIPATLLGEQDLRRAALQAYAAMTHLAESIRKDGLEMFSWLLEASGDAVLSTAGTWVKGLQTFSNLLNWHPSAVGTSGASSWTSTKPTSSKTSSHSKLLVSQLNTLAQFLRTGLTPSKTDPAQAGHTASCLFPLWHTEAHIISSKSDALSYLNLFGAARNIEHQAYETFEERVAIFRESGFLEAYRAGVKEIKKEGGETGRAGSVVEKALISSAST
ncbi:pre-rRNA-processing protein ipi1 [Polychaeton citri CBS 116435]|uniref:Pre-rRNA-processing protein n=1 Tax=Polychaeton citri CBS 116435 TaxID=1314669 RepID=A0A9P4UPH5_9PEZI|nr:pre-rRNA-processing protein ipi1 [Polychaeton citri CBS 116435]